MLSCPEPPGLPPDAAPAVRRYAASALIADYADSVHAAAASVNTSDPAVLARAGASRTAPTSRPVAPSTLSGPLDLCGGSFPPLGKAPLRPPPQTRSSQAHKSVARGRVSVADVSPDTPVLSNPGPATDRPPSTLASPSAGVARTPTGRGADGGSCFVADVNLHPHLRDPTIKRAAELHASFIANSVSPAHTMCSALVTLADALRFLSYARPRASSPPPSPARGVFQRLGDTYSSPVQLCAHAVLAVSALKPLLSLFPPPLRAALAENPALAKYAPSAVLVTGAPAPFPTPKDPTLFTARDGAVKAVSSTWEPAGDSAVAAGPRRLAANLEGTWDKAIDLQRLHRGDNAHVPAGTLDRDAASRAVSSLHPANMDAFAARLLSLLARSALHREQDGDRLKRLSARMTTAPQVSTTAHASKLSGTRGVRPAGPVARAGPGQRNAAPGSGVVLHRIPDVVRTLFRGDGAELFFLEFVDGADSAKLNVALASRLSSALHSALAAAASARTEETFTEAVLQARLSAKLLSATMHIGNWAHSSFSFSGDSARPEGDSRANRLPVHIAQMRAVVCSATWRGCVDLAEILHQALASKHAPAVVGAVLVADILLRVAAVDPVASWTAWFTAGLDSAHQVLRVASLVADSDWEWLSRVPLVRCVLEELLSALQLSHIPPSVAGGASEAYSSAHTAGTSRESRKGAACSLGDLKLLGTCVPGLEDVRRRLGEAGFPRVSSVALPRRIRPLPAALSESGGEAFRTSQAKAPLSSEGMAPSSARRVEAGGLEDEGERSNLARVSSNGVRDELWREFYRRLDKRVRDVALLVVASDEPSQEDCRARMKKAALLLLPDVPESVIEVAAEYCARVRCGKPSPASEASALQHTRADDGACDLSGGSENAGASGAVRDSADGTGAARVGDDDGPRADKVVLSAWSGGSAEDILAILRDARLRAGGAATTPLETQ
jgi:hypothetical protein